MPAPDLKAQTAELFAAYQRQPSQRLQDKIFVLNDGLVKRIACKFAKDGREAYDDLYQIGAIGLVKAIRRFDTSKGNAFSSFACPYIRGEIMHSRRNFALKIPRTWIDAWPKLRRLRDAGASLAEMSAALDWEPEQCREALAAYERPDPISFDRWVDEDGKPWEFLKDQEQIEQSWDQELGMDISRREDGLIDATAICQQHNRRFCHYWQRRGRRYLEALQAKNKRPHIAAFCEISPGRGGRAWVCPELAVDLVRWCDPTAAAAIDALVVGRLVA